MHLIEFKNLVFKWFLEHDTFTYPDDVRKIIVVSETPELDDEILKYSLKSFETGNLVTRFDFRDNKKDKISWVLNQPLHSFEQPIQIAGDLAFAIAQILNQTRDADAGITTNCLQINSGDLEELIVLTSTLINKHNELNN